MVRRPPPRAAARAGPAAAALLGLALAAGACQRGEPSRESARTAPADIPPTTHAPERAAVSWGVDTVICDARITAADGTARDFTLTLYPGGSATLRAAYPGRGEGLDLGWWSARGDSLALQLATKDGRASGTTNWWRLEDAGLRPLVWNREEWGAEGVAFRLRERAGRP